MIQMKRLVHTAALGDFECFEPAMVPTEHSLCPISLTPQVLAHCGGSSVQVEFADGCVADVCCDATEWRSSCKLLCTLAFSLLC